MKEKLKQWALQAANFLELDLGDDELNRRAFTLNVAVVYLFVAVLLQMITVMFFSGYHPAETGGGMPAEMPMEVRVTSLFVMGMLIADFVAYALVMGRKVNEGAWTLVLALSFYAAAESFVASEGGEWELLFVVPIVLALLTLNWESGALLTFGLSIFRVITLHGRELGWLEMEVERSSEAEQMAMEIINLLISFNFLLVMIGITLFLLRRSLQESRQAQQTAEVLSVALERRLDEQAEVRSLLEAAVERYADFLVEASAGQEIAMLDVEEIVGEPSAGSGVAQAVMRSLRHLGEAINETVIRLWSLLRESEEARRNADAAQRRYLRRAWEEYLREREQRLAVEEGKPVDREAIQQAVESALAWRGAAIVREEHVDALAVPIAVGEQVIGVMTLQHEAKTPSDRWTDEERRFAALIADRLSTALNTLRLLDETQRREARERFISQFTTRLRSAATVEEALADAMQALRETFEAREVVARLQVESVEEES